MVLNQRGKPLVIRQFLCGYGCHVFLLYVPRMCCATSDRPLPPINLDDTVWIPISRSELDRWEEELEEVAPPLWTFVDDDLAVSEGL